MKNILVLAALLAFGLPAFAADPIRPDPRLTPGQFHNPPTPLEVLCTPGYTKTVRDVPPAEKTAVFHAYGYDLGKIVRGDYEIDHLIPLILDGTNAPENLWPQSYVTQPLNAHRKDVLETVLHHLVCKRELPLAEAQHAIATDWVAAYNRYVLHHDPAGK